MNKYIFYNYDKVFSYNALLNLIIGERGVGKTYGIKVKLIKRFLKHHKKFAYIRRYESDLDASVGSSINEKFFEQVAKEFPNSEFKISKHKKVRNLYIDGQVCGYALPLSSADSLKSSSYEDVDIIVYDEFMLKEGSSQHYLRNEPEIILDLIETIGRLRDIKIFCLGNAISSTCPLMSYFDLTLPYGNDIKLFKDGLILVQYIDNEEYDGGSLVDALNAINIDSSFDERADIALKNGVDNYRGTYLQNVFLLSLLKEGKLVY